MPLYLILLNANTDINAYKSRGFNSPIKSIILFLLVGIIALIQLKITRKREVQM